jgi:hypothetical protein
MEDVNGEGNPVEAKYRRLARSHRTGRGDRELKPGPEMRDLLNVRIDELILPISHVFNFCFGPVRICSDNPRLMFCHRKTRI